MLYLKTHQGGYRVADEDDVIAEATVIYNRYLAKGTAIESPDAMKAYLKLKLAPYEYEVFVAIFLDNQHHIIACDELFKGTINSSAVYPREVAKIALQYNAAAVIFGHNHPSGASDPSSADIAITQLLKQGLALFEIRVLDHLICGEEVYSFAEHGLI